MKERPTELDVHFGIPGVARVVEGNGGLFKVRVERPDVSGEMYLHGGHVTSWKPAGAHEVLFVSERARWQDDRAIRGGIPVCFPWFGNRSDDPAAPAHGLVRTKTWQLESVSENASGVTVSMSIESQQTSSQWSTGDWRLVHRVTFGAELTLELVVTNTGTALLRFEEALHAYYLIGDIDKVAIRGLVGIQYLDKTDSMREKLQQGRLAIVSETDRVYLNTIGTVDIEDRSLQRITRIRKEHSRTTVVWNPWAHLAQTLSDLHEDGWRQMVCIETSNVSPLGVSLPPGQQHTMRAVISLADLQADSR
jgi:glucose-6-phosphate 1-epimerase